MAGTRRVLRIILSPNWLLAEHGFRTTLRRRRPVTAASRLIAGVSVKLTVGVGSFYLRCGSKLSCLLHSRYGRLIRVMVDYSERLVYVVSTGEGLALASDRISVCNGSLQCYCSS